MNTPVNRYDVDATVINRPTDRVRWAAVFAGLFAAITSLFVLTLLGLAIGLSSYDAGEPASNFGIGAGVWGAISALIAFAIGGWLAARTAALTGRGNGMLNGAMVWIVAIPLLLFVLGSGVSSLLNTAGNVAAAGVNAAGNAAGNIAGNPAAQSTAISAGQDAAAGVQAQATSIAGQITPGNVENAARTAGNTLWGTLLWIVVGFVAASVGGLVGSRPSLAEQVEANNVRYNNPASRT
jgi:hypothetical protein